MGKMSSHKLNPDASVMYSNTHGIGSSGVVIESNIGTTEKPISGDTIKSPENGESPVKVKKAFGLLGGISLIIGTMIGSGIFASARSVASYSGSVGMGLCVWAASGVLATFGSLCYVELGLMLPQSGGEYIYIREAFGDLPAFLLAFVACFVIKPSAIAAIVVASGDYVIEPFLVYSSVEENKIWIAKLIAVFFLTIIIVLNCLSAKIASKVQIVFTASKLLALAIIIVTGIVRLGQGYTASFSNSFGGTTNRISDIGYAFYGGLWAYDGWNNLNYAVEELRNPLRNLPASIMSGLPLVTVLYITVIVSYLTVLTPNELATSSAVAVTLGERIYGVMHWIMPVLVACSTFGAANGNVFAGGRLVFAAARNGHLPKLLAMLHKERNTPIPAVVFNYILAVIMIIPESSSFDQLITYFSFVAWVFYGATFCALLWLRFRRPDMERPYRVFIGIPILMVFCSIYLVLAPFADYPLESLYCVIFILTGIPVYLIFIHFKIIPKSCVDGYGALSRKIEEFGNLALPETEEKM